MAPTSFFPINLEMEIKICLKKNPTNQTGCHDKQEKKMSKENPTNQTGCCDKLKYC